LVATSHDEDASTLSAYLFLFGLGAFTCVDYGLIEACKIVPVLPLFIYFLTDEDSLIMNY
jgi:hypothetical protein